MYMLYIQYAVNLFVYDLNNVALGSRNHVKAPFFNLFCVDGSRVIHRFLCIYVISTLDTLFWA